MYISFLEAHILPLSRRYLKKNSSIGSNLVRNEDLICQMYEKPKSIGHSILTRPDIDYAGELVGYEELKLPPLDPNGQCEVPQTGPLVLEVSFGDPTTPKIQSFQQLLRFNNGIIVNSLKGLRLELSRRMDRKGYDVSKGI